MKKHFKYSILLVFVFFLFQGNLSAQREINFDNPILNPSTPYLVKEKEILDNFLNNAPYVFEGRVIRGAWGNPDEDGLGTASYLFEVEKVYRGGERIKAGTVEIISRENLKEPVISYAENKWYLLFCKESSIPGVFDANSDVTIELFYNEHRDLIKTFLPILGGVTCFSAI